MILLWVSMCLPRLGALALTANASQAREQVEPRASQLQAIGLPASAGLLDEPAEPLGAYKAKEAKVAMRRGRRKLVLKLHFEPFSGARILIFGRPVGLPAASPLDWRLILVLEARYLSATRRLGASHPIGQLLAVSRLSSESLESTKARQALRASRKSWQR